MSEFFVYLGNAEAVLGFTVENELVGAEIAHRMHGRIARNTLRRAVIGEKDGIWHTVSTTYGARRHPGFDRVGV